MNCLKIALVIISYRAWQTSQQWVLLPIKDLLYDRPGGCLVDFVQRPDSGPESERSRNLSDLGRHSSKMIRSKHQYGRCRSSSPILVVMFSDHATFRARNYTYDTLRNGLPS